jgi:hypothetical protein
MLMSNCYLCFTEADISGQDYGRRKSVRCPNCGFYEVTSAAIPKLKDNGMPETARADLIKTIKQLNDCNKNAEIAFDGITLSAR